MLTNLNSLIDDSLMIEAQILAIVSLESVCHQQLLKRCI